MLQTLGHLPIATKNQLDDNKILPVVRRWVEHGHRGKQSSEEESVSSQQQPSSSDEQLEGTVVTEADSVCEPATEQEVGVVSEKDATEDDTPPTEKEEGSSEAEVREADSVCEPVAGAEAVGEVAREVEGEEEVVKEQKDEEEEEEEEEEGSREAEAREVIWTIKIAT